MPEQVILVNEQDEALGTIEKMEAHRKALLHRAFSVFIFNDRGEMLLQQRALTKYHSAGLWTNACCSHPRPDEEIVSEARRRLREELGFTTELSKRFDFVYRSSFENGLTEYEYDHVFTGVFNGAVEPNRLEVKDYCFKTITEIEDSLQLFPAKYTAWFRIAFPKLMAAMNLQSA
jgi:isopentenyl-diphosphate Delta-isomerase